MAQHDAVEVIIAKREGGELSDTQIDWVIDAYTRGVVADEQMSSLAMAILLNGMNRREISRWTNAMIASGERMDFSSLSRPTSDKHSTGGVGDKITLPLAPLVAACGVAVPQLSGRGLGHTGGTLDKLESVPGWRAQLSNEEMLAQLESVGAVICAAGDGLAPADKKLYALRDVTGTVEAIPLIASSIMSKKIAEGTGALVLDVKVGTGAFMKELDDARELARTMVALGQDAGVHTVALLTDMSTPLGLTAGNAIEVEESVEVLAGGGPADVVELTLALAREMLAGAGRGDLDPADKLADGSAMDAWKAMIRAQGGDPDAGLPVARESHVVAAPASGVLTRLDAMAVGLAAWRLGAGRARKEDPGWVPAGPGRRTRCRPGPGWCGTPGPATRSPRASRCSRCSPTSRSASSEHSPHWTVATTSATRRRTPLRSWSSTASPDGALRAAGVRRTRRRRRAWPRPRSRSCGARSAACHWGCR
jgi:thymidine phosphorylase